jgi:hypothetical protein
MRRASYPTPVFGASPNGPDFIGRGFNPKVRTRVKRVSPILLWQGLPWRHGRLRVRIPPCRRQAVVILEIYGHRPSGCGATLNRVSV